MAKTLIENSKKVYIWQLMKQDKLSAGRLLALGCIPLKVMLGDGSSWSQFLSISCSKTNFNGKRVWFVCPECKRRMGCLFLPLYSNKLLCRHCLNLSYKYQARHQDLVWEMVGKYVHRFDKIKQRLNNKWLRSPKKERLRTEKARIYATCMLNLEELIG